MSLLSKVQSAAPSLPSRVVLYAQEKFGKSSFAAHAPEPIFLMSAGETGLLSLIEAGRVPPTNHFPEDFKDWQGLQSAVGALLKEQHDYKTLVLDTANGCESLCMKHICDRQFRGDWAEFGSFGKGMVQSVKAWQTFLGLLDEVRTRRRMSILLLHHARVRPFSDPSGKDYDQWRPESEEKLWSQTHKWSDVILFGGFKVQVRHDKAIGDSTRYLRTDATPAIVAGNRYGLPPEINAAAGASNLWGAFANALRAAKAKGAALPKPQTPQQEATHKLNAELEWSEAPPLEALTITGEEVQELIAVMDHAQLTWPDLLRQYGQRLGLVPATKITTIQQSHLAEIYEVLRQFETDEPPASTSEEPEHAEGIAQG